MAPSPYRGSGGDRPACSPLPRTGRGAGGEGYSEAGMARIAPARRRSRSWLLVLLLLGVVGGLVLAPGPAQQVEAYGSRLLEPIQATVSGLFGEVEDVTSVIRRMTELSRQ